MEEQKKGEQRRRSLQAYADKNNITGDPRMQHHAPCSTYFNEKIARRLEKGPESAIFNTFGYKCCGKERDLSVDRFYPRTPTKNSEQNPEQNPFGAP